MMFFTGHCSLSHSLFFLHLLLHDLSTLFYGFFFQHFLFTFRALSLFYFLYFFVSSIYYNICHVCLFLLSSLFSSKFFPSNFHSNSLSVKTPDDIWQIDKFSLFILSSLLLPTSFCHLFFSPHSSTYQLYCSFFATTNLS